MALNHGRSLDLKTTSGETMADKKFTAITRPSTRCNLDDKTYCTGEVLPAEQPGLGKVFGSEAAAKKHLEAHAKACKKAMEKIAKR